MEQLISLLIYVVVFAIVAVGLYYVCKKFELPQPVLWICGAILLIIILVFLAGKLAGPTGFHLSLIMSTKSLDKIV